jgi:hypothetical protein
MRPRRLSFVTRILILAIVLGSCNLPLPNSAPISPASEQSEGDLSIATPLPPLPETLVSFRVQAPANTPPDEEVYLSILDEVTGLALNTEFYAMTGGEDSSEESGPSYVITLPFKIGSVIKYRYERQAGSIRVAEHLSDGSPVRYRLYYVQGQGAVEDVISRWTDTSYEAQRGRVRGEAKDAETGQPIPNLLVVAGGAQAITTSDGSFLLEGLPPGVHNLVAYALDGSYQTFQQGARVAADSTTPAPLKLERAEFVKAVFVTSLPPGTPPVVPLRLAGNLYQLGNTFASLTGGMSGVAVNMPTLHSLPDGRYTVSIELPIGADIRYKYTLGDGFWNAEHDATGDFRLRQVVIPDHNVLIEDQVVTWYAGDPASLTFDVYVPAETPPQDFIAIQFGPLFGWTEPIPMWPLGGNRWAYILYSPLNLPGNFNYRYCRNGQCGTADDIQTPGLYGPGRPVVMESDSVAMQDGVSAWINWQPGEQDWPLPAVEAPQRGPDFWAGVEFLPTENPSWNALLPASLDTVKSMGANWLVLSPTWSFGRNAPGNDPPLLSLLPGQDALWFDLLQAANQASERGLSVAIKPTPRFLIDVDEWWASAPRDFAWWVIWFEQYRAFVLHHADLAAQSGASALILGGEWLDPALPGGVLADGTPSGVPEDAETRWRDLFAEVRAHYDGPLAWAMPYKDVFAEPPFLDAIDQIYLLFSFPPGTNIEAELGASIDNWLDYNLWTLQILSGKPLIMAVDYPSDPDMGVQLDAYQALINAASGRDWITGFVSRGYYPPVALQDASPSINGKPAADLLGEWYPLLVGER